MDLTLKRAQRCAAVVRILHYPQECMSRCILKVMQGSIHQEFPFSSCLRLCLLQVQSQLPLQLLSPFGALVLLSPHYQHCLRNVQDDARADGDVTDRGGHGGCHDD